MHPADTLTWSEVLTAGAAMVSTVAAAAFATDELPRRRRTAQREADRTRERTLRRSYQQVDHDGLPLTDDDWDFAS
jgi:hypothetical protein